MLADHDNITYNMTMLMINFLPLSPLPGVNQLQLQNLATLAAAASAAQNSGGSTNALSANSALGNLYNSGKYGTPLSFYVQVI